MKVILGLPVLALTLAVFGCMPEPNDGDLFGPVPTPTVAATSTPGSSSSTSTGGSSSSSTSGSSSSSSSSSGSGGSPVVEEPVPCSPDMSTDDNNCGACGNVCPTMQQIGTWTTDLVCVQGSCVLDCSTHPLNASGRYGDCDGDPTDGCEADFYSDPQNCGGCGIVCGAGLHCKITDYVNTTAKCVL